MIFIIGTGNVFAETPPTYLYNGNPNSLAAAFATARETPRMAFAPNFDLFGVPSKSHHLVNHVLFKTDVPKSSSAIILTFFTAFKTPPFPK
jgi:hypothetical protein